jgi:hypothetical protein
MGKNRVIFPGEIKDVTTLAEYLRGDIKEALSQDVKILGTKKFDVVKLYWSANNEVQFVMANCEKLAEMSTRLYEKILANIVDSLTPKAYICLNCKRVQDNDQTNCECGMHTFSRTHYLNLPNKLRDEITKVIYQSSHDDSECLRIKFENVEPTILKLCSLFEQHREGYTTNRDPQEVRDKIKWYEKAKNDCVKKRDEALQAQSSSTTSNEKAHHAETAAGYQVEIGKAEINILALKWAIGE